MKPAAIGSFAALALCLATGAGAAAPACDRACLAAVMNSYLQALVHHDPGSLPARRNIKYTENGVRLNLGDGLWQTAAALPTYRLDVIDDEAGQVGLLGRISENGNNNWFAVRLKVEQDHKISEIEALINRSISAGPGAGPPGGAKANTEPHALMSQLIPADRRLPRAELARIGNSYFTGMADEDSSANVPFSPLCQRRENGTVTANNPDSPKGSMQWLDCKSQFDTGFSVIVTNIRERRFAIVDRTRGLAFGWGYFDHDGTHAKFSRTLDHQQADVSPTFRQPITFYIAEVFKVMDGQIRQIEAVLTTVPFRMESGW
ncbi:MAG TPA: hypothetical protein VMC02_09250 [Steroidobacteraceae bacterium]|nr:hypothetical protein [Steroidobacteraceae bacterium]